jgi:hypothetical protein
MTDPKKETSGPAQPGCRPAEPDKANLVAASDSDCDQGLSERQRAELNDPQKQRRYRLEYLLQILRTRCPGCGEEESPL